MPILTATEDLERILVSRTDGLGDVIVTFPLAVAIKRLIPNAEVAFMVTPYTAPIARRIAEIDRVVTISELRRGLHVMKVYAPNAIIFARPEFKLALEAVLAQIDVRIGTGYRWYSGLFTRWVYDHRRKGARHEAEYGVNLLSPLLEGPLPVEMPVLIESPAGITEAGNRLREAGIDGEYMVIHPGSRGSASSYPADSYADVARGLLEGKEDLHIVVTAGPGEDELALEVVDGAGMPGRISMIADMTLDGLSELYRGARGFLGSSSGPAHLAALVRTPTVGLYPGLPPLWPARWKPLGPHVSTLVPHAEEPECSECERKHQPENCVRRIAPERVIEACEGMLIGRDAGTKDYISP